MNDKEKVRIADARILVIEGDPGLRETLQGWLAREQANVAVAASADEAFRILQSFSPEVVVCDMRLPDRLGLDVLAGIQQKCPDTRVILTSLISDTVMVVQALRLGAADYLFKPLKQPLMLLHAVRRALADARLQLENRRYRQALEQTNRELGESLRLLREDQEAGLAVQMKLLPPQHKNYGPVDINFRIKPSLLLSGDFVDHFRVSETQFGFYLADVSGHGASSAFVTIMLKNMANRLRKRYEDGKRRILTPAEVLLRANEEMLSMALGKHLSVFCAMIDLSERKLVYCSASHFPPPRIFMGGRVLALEAQGLPVGLFEKPGYQDRELDLEGPFELWACSDGALEVLDASSLAAKEQKLVEIMQQADHNVDTFLSLLGVAGQATVPDDIAVLQVSGRC